MDTVTQLLVALNVNHTVWIQVAIFVIVYLVILNVMVKPYQIALKKRSEKTVGQTDAAERILSEADQLQSEFEKKAQALSQEHAEIYNKERTAALKSYDEMVQAARTQAKSNLDVARNKIEKEVMTLGETLKAEAPLISKEIQKKLIGKEVALS